MEQKDLEQEQKYLQKVLVEIDNQTYIAKKQINELEKQMSELTHYFSEEYYFLDDEETVTGGDEMDDVERVLNATKLQLFKLNKQKISPYFGKIDFFNNDKLKSYYIGTFSLTSGTQTPFVCDWRAPVSSLYYDYELGKASYKAQIGEISGEIKNKRQFKIKDGKMVYCFDSALTIGDEILQQELSLNATQKMKQIVATIQKEQNKIIRDERDTLFIQGVAGSGKTSIALHRIAYLLYKQREKYKSSDILILSPNYIFSDYISSVLPSLGEENVLETSFFQIAKDELVGLVPPLQTREQAINELAVDSKRLNEVAYKNCFDFAESLKNYLKMYVNLSFNAKDLTFGDVKITKQELEELYNQKYQQKTPATRVEWIADYILDRIDASDKAEELVGRVKKVLYPMFISNSLLDVYVDFLSKIGMKFSFSDEKTIRFEDISPILYIKNYILGIDKKSVKYLVVDELQDYSPVQLELINSIFDCPKTVLGDISQCIEKIIEPSDLPKYANIIGADEILTLNKTYRSTKEITEFSNKIKKINANSVERHGKQPQIQVFDSIDDEISCIENIVKQNSKYQSIAIICKTENDAKQYYDKLNNLDELVLMQENSNMSNLMIMPASLAKGLEFDMVIIPNVSTACYNNFLDKNLLYVSCTRALHELYLTSPSNLTKFLK